MRTVTALALTLAAAVPALAQQSGSISAAGKGSTPNLGGERKLGIVARETKLSATQGGLFGEVLSFNMFGSGVSSIGDFDGDGIDDMVAGKFHDADGGEMCGCVYIMLMDPDGTPRTWQKISGTQGGLAGLNEGDHFGTCVASIGDHDGDGVTDLIVGAWHDEDFQYQGGVVWVLLLNPDGTVKNGRQIGGGPAGNSGGFGGVIAEGDHFGTSVAGLGDLDGDGFGDVVVGARGDHDWDRPGKVWVLLLNQNGTVKGQTEIGAGAGGFTGLLEDGDFFGEAVENLGDLDGDGRPELAVSAPGDDDGGVDRGAVWILSLNPDGTVFAQVKLSSATSPVLAAMLEDDGSFGTALADAGDFDGDGDKDLFVGAETDDDGGWNQGAVHLLYLRPDLSVESTVSISETAGAFMGQLDPDDAFGHSAAVIGDLDGNGTPELAVGAWKDDDTPALKGDSGAIWVLFLDVQSPSVTTLPLSPFGNPWTPPFGQLLTHPLVGPLLR